MIHTRPRGLRFSDVNYLGDIPVGHMKQAGKTVELGTKTGCSNSCSKNEKNRNRKSCGRTTFAWSSGCSNLSQVIGLSDSMSFSN